MDMSQHFTTKMLLRYTYPAMLMMLASSVYGIVDGLFVSNFAGKTAFASVTLIAPFVIILGAVGYMMGSGGSALVAKTRGEGDDARANGYFSLIICATFAAGLVLAALGFAGMEQAARFLGASDDMLPLCVLYGRIVMLSLPFYLLQFAFETFSSTAGKPKLGLYTALAAGCTNIAFDALFVAGLGWGVAGAALGTVLAEVVGGTVPLVYFARANGSALRLGRPAHELRALGKACVNGSSEMVASVAFSFVAVVYNWQLMRLIGENGVAAIGVVEYASMVFGTVFAGYNMGAAPLMSYQHGAGNNREKQSLMRHGFGILIVSGIAMFALSEALARPLSWAYTGYDAQLQQLTEHAFRIYAFAFLFMGLGEYGSSLFTALNDGPVSAAISFLRTLVFDIGAILLLPLALGVDGVWVAVPVAECLAMLLALAFVRALGPRYGLIAPRTRAAG